MTNDLRGLYRGNVYSYPSKKIQGAQYQKPMLNEI